MIGLHEVEEGDPQWMAWLGDRLCPRCGHQIKQLVPTPVGCAMAYPCGHKVLRGRDGFVRAQRLIRRD